MQILTIFYEWMVLTRELELGVNLFNWADVLNFGWLDATIQDIQINKFAFYNTFFYFFQLEVLKIESL